MKNVGLLAVALIVIGLVFVVVRWPRGRHATFSQHVAPYRSAIVFYAGLFLVTLPLLNLFIIQWLVPNLRLSVWFSVLVGLSSLLQVVCTFVPEIGRQIRLHQLLAGMSAILLLPALALLAWAPSISGFDKTAASLGMVAMLIIIAIVIVQKSNVRNALLLQALYYGAFFAPVLLATY